MQPFKVLRRSAPLDTSRMMMARSGIVENLPEDPISPERDLESFSPDIDGVEFSPQAQTPSPDPDNTQGTPDYLTRRETVWCPRVNDLPRVISQGDIVYDLGQEVYAVLPFWQTGNSETTLRRMFVIKGVISDLAWRPVADQDIPREVSGRVSPDVSSNNLSPWAQALSWNPFSPNLTTPTEKQPALQTMFTHVTLVLDKSFAEPLSNHPLAKILPYEYDLRVTKTAHPKDKKAKKSKGSNRKTIEVTIPYHYLLGNTPTVKKAFGATEDQRIQSWIDKLKIGVGDGVEDLDSGIQMRIVDYYFTPTCELLFVVQCLQAPRRILHLKKLQAFNIRGLYDHARYHSFKVGDPRGLKIHAFQNHDHNRTEIHRILKEAFDKIGIYLVKKSLSGQQDVASRIYEDAHGSSQVYPKHQGASVPEEGLRFTGITLTSYAKGLAYLEGQEPPDGVSYIFFHSRDYYEIDLSPESSTFLELVPTAEKQDLFRNPDPNDVILAQSFICEKGQYTGKTNLRWFYPTDDFRLLHLYVTKPTLKTALAKTIAAKKFEAPCLDLYNLLLYGTSSKNPTLQTSFTQAFSRRYFWWL